jgi:DNA-binding NarL/FixJ family response regulator
MVGDDGDRDSLIEHAIHAAAAQPQPFEAARTELAVGEQLRRARRRAEARVPLRSALATFERLGARTWADRARSELAASGERARRRTDEAAMREELTPQELRIARMVAEGASNKEAAAALFLSPKTIEYHLASVYRKLGVRKRAALGRALEDHLSA